MKKTPEELALDAYMASLNEKKLNVSDNKLIANAKLSKERKGQTSIHKGKERSFKGKPRVTKSVEYHSEETKKKISEKKKGKPSLNKGKSLLESTKQKICKKIKTPDGIFNSRNDASTFYNVKPSTISFRLKKYSDQYFYIEDNPN